MPNRNNHWITQRENGWADVREGNQRATKIYDTQLEAFYAAREIARQEGGEVIITGTDGLIRERNTYGKPDHCPPKG